MVIRLSFKTLKKPLMAYSAFFVLALTACTVEYEEPEYREQPVESLYNQAQDLAEAGQHEEAAAAFDEVERQHPYSRWATRSQIMAAYNLYQENLYSDAVIALDRFIQLHPSNKDVPYALYLKGLCYYEQISDVTRDQKMTKLAMASFNDLVTRYPASRYAKDAKLKLDLTLDHLAGKEMDIGRFYLIQKQYLAAVNRFEFVVRKYETTSHVPEALHRLVEAYSALGLHDEAKRAASVLGHNYPGSEWYVDSYDSLVDPDKRVKKAEEEPWYKFW